MIRLKEAMARAREEGLFRRKGDLAQKIWTNSSPKSAYMNLLNLEYGNSKKIDVESVAIICKECNVSADYLFGLTDMPNYQAELKAKKDEAIAKANDLIQTISTL